MTREEKIIATAFTGKMFIDGSEMGPLYEYMEKKVGYGVIDIMLASKEFWEELHRACEQDFIDMVSKEWPSLPSDLDEAVNGVMPISYGFLEVDCYGGSEPVYSREQMVEMFKAGAEWMAGQGVSWEDKMTYYDGFLIYGQDERAYTMEGDFNEGDKVVVQIRKK